MQDKRKRKWSWVEKASDCDADLMGVASEDSDKG